uniref:Uncharacterized protein n=1 Tax=Cacopsylla melanoneura TaxID=428564 RepID=A0A8D9F108_9HEMI
MLSSNISTKCSGNSSWYNLAFFSSGGSDGEAVRLVDFGSLWVSFMTVSIMEAFGLEIVSFVLLTGRDSFSGEGVEILVTSCICCTGVLAGCSGSGQVFDRCPSFPQEKQRGDSKER